MSGPFQPCSNKASFDYDNNNRPQSSDAEKPKTDETSATYEERIYENDEGHYVDMTSPHLAIYVMPEDRRCDNYVAAEDIDDEHIYEDINVGDSRKSTARPPRPKSPKPNRKARGSLSVSEVGPDSRATTSSSVNDIVEECECCKKYAQQLSAAPNIGSPRRHIDDDFTRIIPVSSLTEISRADHVTWKRPVGIWHHAIVIDVDLVTGQLEVVHYNGSIRRKDGEQSFASVRREWVAVSLRSKDLYHVEYDRKLVSTVKCFPADVVIERALSRVGETEYNPLTLNCEHFARWCKTGKSKSVQLENMPSRLRATADKFADRLVMEGPASMIKSTVDKVSVKSTLSGVERLAMKGARGIFSRVAPQVERVARTAIEFEETLTDGLINKLDRVIVARENLTDVQNTEMKEPHD